MKISPYYYLGFILLCLVFNSCSEAKPPVWEKTEIASATPPGLIPLPKEVTWGSEIYTLPEENTICYDGVSGEIAQWVDQLLESSGMSSVISQGGTCGNIKIVSDPSLEEELGKEGYLLDIDSTGISITGASEAGLFYGVQTLRQFFPAEIEQGDWDGKVALREVHIKDQPFYSWRGNMIDVARSFFGVEYLKDHIDRMAAYKLNRLHLHLTDDQGWRIEIKSKPKLTEIGGNSSVKNGRSGFLTQEEYIELQEYAAARNIIIVPEIDMPGHIYAALRSYPELNCDDLSNLTPAMTTFPEPYHEYRVGWSKFCLEKKEVVYDFVATVIGELAAITKGPWIHIGGDEIKDPLYESFVVKADSIVRSLGKTSVGWEEVTKAKVDPSLISQQWHGRVEPQVDTKIIKSLCSHFYLDHANVPGQENTNNWCKESGVSIKEVYNFKTDNPDVIGVEAAVWSEFVLSDHIMDDRYWPRNLAVAEVAWTPASKRNFSDFIERANSHSSRLGNMGIHYFLTPEINWGDQEIAENSKTVFSGFMPDQK